MTRAITAADFDFIYGLYMHPDINPFLLYEMMDSTSFEPVYNDLLERNIIYIYEAGSTAAGMFKFIPQLHRNAHMAYLGGLAVHPSFAGKGHGISMMQEIIELGKNWGLARIELSTAITNEKAIHLYEKIGFEKEGLLRKYTWLKSEGRFIDEVMMSYLYEQL